MNSKRGIIENCPSMKIDLQQCWKGLDKCIDKERQEENEKYSKK
jgi:hypothetical protein